MVEMRSFVWRTAMLFSRGFFGESQRVQSLLLGVGAFMLAFDYIRYVRARRRRRRRRRRRCCCAACERAAACWDRRGREQRAPTLR